MSGRTITKFVLVCDGCGAEIRPHDSSIEARAAAYADGWRFPARLTESGSTANTADDACPACVPDWKPRPSKVWQKRRAKEAS